MTAGPRTAVTRTITRSDTEQPLRGDKREPYRQYFTVRFFTGMRTGEAHGLKWKYIDFERRLILVREAIVLKEEDELKTDGSVRDIQMNDLVFDALQAQFKVTGKTSEFVFCNRNGTPIDNQNFLNRVWSPLLRHLDIPHRRAYQMRHTAATLWLASGEAPEWIARQLGHTSTEMLFRVYSRYVPNLTRRDGSAMERLLKQHISVTPVSGNAIRLPEESQDVSLATSSQASDVDLDDFEERVDASLADHCDTKASAPHGELALHVPRTAGKGKRNTSSTKPRSLHPLNFLSTAALADRAKPT